MLSRHRRAGLTLIEVLVVIAVIALLIALAVPAIQRAREAANRTACANNLRQLTVAVHTCHDATGDMPPYSTGQAGTSVFGGWWIHLMPYASQTAFHDDILKTSNDTAVGGGTLSVIAATLPKFRDHRFPLLMCASDPTLRTSKFAEGTTNYLANWFVLGDGVKGCYAPAQKFHSIRTGLSNAALFAEGYSTCNGLTRESLIACGTHNFGITWNAKPSDDPSYAPNNYLMFQVMPPVQGAGCCMALRAQTPHANMPVAFADGSVRFVERDIPLATWTQLMKPR